MSRLTLDGPVCARRQVALIVALVLASSCSSPRSGGPTVSLPAPQLPGPNATTTAPLPAVPVVRVSVPGQGVRALAMEDYLTGVVSGELAVGALDPVIAGPMLELQAVVARTWAVAHRGRHAREGFDFCTTTHCQVMRADAEILPANRPAIRRAVEATRGWVLVHEGRPIDAVFHSDCGGSTGAADLVWGGQGRPYLRAVADEPCRRRASSAWRYSAADEDLRRALNADARTAVGERLDALRVLQHDDSGRVALVALDGARSPVVRGEQLRAVLARQFGPQSIRSPRYTIGRDGGRWVFTGRGRGHGVGLCQLGAMARLRAGAAVGAVLATYYPGSRLATPDERQTSAATAERGMRRTSR